MTTLLALHFLAAGVAPVAVRVLDRRAFWLLALVPAGSFAWLLPRVGDVTSGAPPIRLSIGWISTIGLDLDLIITPLSGILALLVTGVGAVVLLYCAWYFKPGDTEMWRFTAVLVAFAGSMLGLVLSDNVFGLYVFWELTTVLSYLLIGHNPERLANRRAATNALLVTTFGGLAMLGGLAVLAHEAGTTSLYEIVQAAPRGTAVTVAVLLVLVGALSKSALVPFHFWLPGAMAAPTPVSAYLHAAAMVKAGIFLVALLAPGFAGVPGWRPLLIVVGLATMVIGGATALRQTDAKLLLAHGTISQLGFLTTLVGAGTRQAAFAGLAVLIAHALFKSTLFLLVGIVDRSTGTRDITELSGLARSLPGALVAMVLAGASMAGIPPLLGFTAKESALAAALNVGPVTGGTAWLVTTGIVIGSILTVAYTTRLVWGVFSTKPGRAATAVVPPPPGFLAGPLALALGCLAFGFAGHWLTQRLLTHVEGFPADEHAPVLTLWHGINLPLVLSAVCIAGGLAVFAVTHRTVRTIAAHQLAERGFTAIVRAIDRVAVEVTGRTQRGSLPIYLGVVLVVLVAVPGTALALAWGSVDHDVVIADNALQAVVAALICVAAVLTVRSRRRLRAVLMLGVTGYGTALLFVVHGAPDLALTQVLVETFLLVTFVLVLRRLPPFFSDRPFNANRWARMAIGALTGLAVAGFAAVAASSRTAAPDSAQFAGPAVDFGGGRNIVNVTIVDIRAWDTLGELSVLVVAATGVASLIFLLTDRSTRPGRATPEVSRSTRAWVRPQRRMSDDRRSIVLEVVTRLLFHAILIVSIYVMLAGHNLPGGGFAGGLIAGLALMVRYLAGGREELDAAAPVDAGALLGLGLAVAALSGLLPTLLGGGVLQSTVFDIHLPFGDLHLVTSVFFDIGVYLVVIGLALDVMRSLGGGIDKHAASDEVAA